MDDILLRTLRACLQARHLAEAEAEAEAGAGAPAPADSLALAPAPAPIAGADVTVDTGAAMRAAGTNICGVNCLVQRTNCRGSDKKKTGCYQYQVPEVGQDCWRGCDTEYTLCETAFKKPEDCWYDPAR